MTKGPLDDLLADLEALEERKLYHRISYFKPYAKQTSFLYAGLDHHERLFMAGNQLGKTETGAYEVAVHLTGLYPPDWKGRRWNRPVKGWAAGQTSYLARDVQQKKLLGEPGVVAARGTGMIPKQDILEITPARGIADAVDTVQVQHYDANGEKDGISILRFKSYEQGRAKFQGETLDFVWFDEEPPADIYSEGRTRVTATQGMVMLTFTPLLGMSDIVLGFLNEDNADRSVTTMGITDAEHIPDSERDRIINSYPTHEREARANGTPMLGSGRIFTTPEEAITEQPLEYIPQYWTKIWGTDFGIDHPFAAALLLWDRDNDVVHLHYTVRMKDALPIQHAAAMKPIGAAVPVAWPQDGTARESDGTTLASQYRKTGLLMLPNHATWEDGGISTEAGILEMQARMSTNRFKVSCLCTDWFEEYRMYHRDKGKIVKLRDDLMSATRVGIMMLRCARNVSLGGKYNVNRHRNPVAEGMDFDVFSV